MIEKAASDIDIPELFCSDEPVVSEVGSFHPAKFSPAKKLTLLECAG